MQPSARFIRVLRLCLVLFPLVIFWYAFISIVAFASSNSSSSPPNAKARQELAVKGVKPSRVEPLDEYLERTDVCEELFHPAAALNESLVSLNASVSSFCAVLLEKRVKFYRRSPTRLSVFDPSLTSLGGENICNQDTDMVVVVHSLHSHRDRRNAIRETWGAAAKSKTWPHVGRPSFQPNIRLAFIFGIHESEKEEKQLVEESNQYRDIVQGNFMESYQNMTLKSLLGLGWVTQHCPSVKYLFKCDDDMFINIPAIWRALVIRDMTWSIMGPLNYGSRVYRSGKWKVSKEQFPFAFYPPYESGSGYAISADLFRPLLDAAGYVPRIFIDDVYVTGILGKILKVNHVRQGGFAYGTSKAPKVCDLLTGAVLTGTRVSPLLQQHIWHDLINKINCHNYTAMSLENYNASLLLQAR